MMSDQAYEKLQDEIERLTTIVSELEPRAAFGDQCWQDQCQNAYIEQSVVKRLLNETKAMTALRCAELLETTGVMLKIIPGETKQDRCVRFARMMALKIRKEFGL